MPQWRVRDVMTTEVITAPDHASAAQIVTLLTERQISAVPIVDRFDVVLGVVSWTDLRKKIKISEPHDALRARWWRRAVPPLPQWPEGTAVEMMSGPPLTIEADAPLPAAARMMYRGDVGRLLVVDSDRRLRGIVTRSDLLKIHARLDPETRDEVMQHVLERTLMIPPGTVQATVHDGRVTLTGRTIRKTTAVAVARLTEAVPGVTDVIDRLDFDLDDTVAAAVPAPVRDPLHRWWIGRQPARSAGRTAGDRVVNHAEQKMAQSAALQ
jgi:CBS-domain-containing membrane protein